MAENVRPKATSSHRKAIKQATCLAFLAASLAAPLPSEAGQIAQSAGTATAVLAGGGLALLKGSTIDAVRRYCSSSWRQAGVPAHDWDDCTQDVMMELFTRLNATEIESGVNNPDCEHRRELMRSVWCVTQRWRRANKRLSVSLDQVGEVAKNSKTVADGLDLERLEIALTSLSPTQRDIVARARSGESVAEIADSLDLPAPRVSDQKYKAVKKLKAILA